MLYLDAVLDSSMNVLYNGTPEDTVKWLGGIASDPTWQVCRGSDMVTVSVEAYLTAYRERKEAVLRGKRRKVKELVAEAMIKQDKATYEGRGLSIQMKDIEEDITDRIVKIFE